MLLLLLALGDPAAKAVSVLVPPHPANGRQAKVSSGLRVVERDFDLWTTGVADAGRGYTSPPPVRVVSTLGTGAAFQASWSSHLGTIYYVSVTARGSGYSDDATVVVDPPHLGDFQAALDDADVSEIQLEEGVYYQNAVITRDLVIRGRGIGRTLVSGALLDSVVKVRPGVTLRLEDLTLYDGLALNGGGINNEGGSVTLERVEIRNCRAYGPAGEGGAIYNHGAARLSLVDCHLHDNAAARAGGGLSNSGLNTSFLPAVAGGTQRAGNVIQDFFLGLAGLHAPPPDEEHDPWNYNPDRPPAPRDFDGEADGALNALEGLYKGLLGTLGDIPTLFGTLSADTFESAGWSGVASPATEVVRTRIENNRVGFGIAASPPQMLVVRPVVAGYRLVQTWFSVYWEPLIVGYDHRMEHVPDPRAVGFGAGIHNDLGLVRLRDSVVEGNTVATHLGSFGGAVSSVLGAVLAEDTRLNGNEANASTVLCSGGGVFNLAGWLRAAGTTLNRNRVNAGLFLSSGGGLKNTLLGVAELRRCEFEGNVSGGGGGIANDYLAQLALDDSTVAGNRISGIIGANGGGIRNEAGGRAVLERCTIADNEARGKAKGAGFYNQCEQLRMGPADAPIIPIAVTTAVLRNCTISGNRAVGQGLLDLPLLAFGGGLYNGSFNLGIAVLDLHSCTIAGNEARGGLVAQGGGLYTSALSSLKLKPAENIPGLSIANLANNLFAANVPADLHNSLLGVTAFVNSEGWNLDSDGTGAAVTGSSGFRRGDARLAPLARNGGPTSTHALLPGSAARDQGSPDGELDAQRAPLTDQRGLLRALGGRRDIGAHESVPPTSYPDRYEVLEGRTLTLAQAGGLLANDFGDAMTLHSVTPPAAGTLDVAPDGAFTYTSPRHFSGVVLFSYRAVDAQGVVGPPTAVEITVLRSLDLLDMDPAPHALAGDPAGPITLTFDEPVDRFDVEAGVWLEGRLTGRLAFTATTSGHVAMLQPLQPWQPGDRITVSLTDRLRAAAGHPLREPILRQFDVGARMGEGRFGPGPELDSPPGPKTLLVDLDGDGDLDLVTTAAGNSVWLNDGAGNFVPTGQALTCHHERIGEIPGIALAAGDLTGNGLPDIVVVTHEARARHAVWFNEGGGRFRRSSQMLATSTGWDFFGGQTYARATDVAVGDLDGDSRADILIASPDAAQTQIWFNDGRQRFHRGQRLLTLEGAGAARLADLDGDGRLDIVLAQFGSDGGARVLLNQGGGRFNTAGSPFGPNWCNALAVADLNGDGFPDLCLTRSQFGTEHRIYLNDGTGGFTPGSVLTGGGFVTGVAVADLNHDGRPDLVLSSGYRPGEVWLGDGAGGFARSPQTIPVQASGVDIGDVDGDGDIDLVFSSSAAQVWLNNRRPLAGTPPAFTVPKNGRLDFALPGTLLGTASDPDGDPVAVTTLVTIEHRRPTLGLIWMEFGGVETSYEGDWPDGEYVYREVRPVFARHGALDLRADGTFTYEPAPGYLGPDSFTYTVTDGISESLPATVQITVTGDPDEPAPRRDWYPHLEFQWELDGTHILGAHFEIDVPAAEGVLVNDENRHGVPWTAQLVTPPAHGVVHLRPDGSFFYRSFDATTWGIDQFSYRIVAGTFVSPPVPVLLGTRAIEVADDFYPAPDGTPFVVTPEFGVLANDWDPNHDRPAHETAWAVLDAPPAHGTVEFGAHGGFTYTPNAGYRGPDSFTYLAVNFGGQFPRARVKLGNTAPLAVDDGGYHVFADSVLNVPAARGVMANDADPDGDPSLTAHLLAGAANGSVTLDPDGSFTYTPAAGFVGDDRFTYRVSDGLEFSGPANVTVRVHALLEVVAVAPAAHGSTAGASPTAEVTFSRALVPASLAGRVTLVGGLTGTRSFNTVVDGAQLRLTPSAPFLAGEQVTVTVHAGIEGAGQSRLERPHSWQFHVAAPRGGARFTRTVAGTSTGLFSEFAAAGDLNGDGLPDVVAWNRDAFPTVYLNQGGGAFSERSESLGATHPGFLGFPPVLADFDGDGRLDVVLLLRQDSPFGGLITDLRLGLNNGAGSFPVTRALPTSAPGGTYLPRVLLAGDFDGDGDLDLLAGSSAGVWLLRNDGTGHFTLDEASFLSTANVRGGAVGDLNGDGWLDAYLVGTSGDQVLLNQGNGRFALLPQALNTAAALTVALRDFNGDGHLDALVGTTAFQVPNALWINDGTGRFRRGGFDLEISPTMAVADGDLNGDGHPDVWQANTRDGAGLGGGDAAFLNDGAGRFTRVSPLWGTSSSFAAAVADFDGDGDLDVFVANDSTATGSSGAGNELWINRSVPTARDDFYAAAGSSAVIVPAAGVLQNDLAGDGGAMSAVLVTPPSRGTVTLGAGGGFTYTPGGAFAGSDVFTYLVRDSGGDSAPARVKIGNTAPAAAADGPYVAVLGGPLDVPAAQGLLANDADADGDALVAQLKTPPARGSLVLRPDGSFRYTPFPDAAGADSFTYVAHDGLAASTPAVVTFEVRGRLELVESRPAPNAAGAPLHGAVLLTFNHPLDPASAAAHVSVAGAHSRPKSLVREVNGTVLKLTPATPFSAGERVTVTLRPGLAGTGGEWLPHPILFEFIAEGPAGSGSFTDSLQRWGDADYNSTGIALGDLDGDGRLDAAIPNGATQFGAGVVPLGTRVWRNAGGGVLADSGQALGAAYGSRAVLADLDGDGHLDIVTRVSAGGGRLFYNNGAGQFTEAPQTLTTELLSGLLAADVNGDGRPDLVGFTATKLFVWLNEGAGNFSLFPAAAARLNLANRTLMELGLADLDGDGALDIVARQFSAGAPMLVWLNNGRGEFSEAGGFGGGGNGLALGDLDGDGTVDVFAPTANGPFVWLNDGHGRFTATAQTYGNFIIVAAALADLDGDGFLDAVVVQRNATPTFTDPIFNRTVMWRNDGRGGFTAGSQILGDFGPDTSGGERVPTSVTLGDVNGDGAVDVVLTGGFRLPNQVWLNTPALPKPGGTAQLAIRDTETVRPFAAVSLRVPPTDVVSLEVSLDDPARGALLSASLAAAGFTGPVGGVHVRAASAAAEAEAALRQLVFGPAANRRPVGQAETTRFQLVVRRGAATRTDGDTTVAAFSVNDPPVARDDGGAGFTTSESAAFTTASVLANDSDPDPGDALTVAAFDASGTLGTVTHLGNGIFRYDPRGRFTALGVGETATDSFTYVVEDPHGARAAARVFITVNGENQPPLAAADQLAIRENSGQNVITAAVLANDTDPDAGDALRLQIIGVNSSGTLGTVQLGADGSLTYSPAGSGPNLAAGATRADSFGYKVRDPAGATASAQVTIVILGENDPPVLSPVTLTAAEDAGVMNVTPHLLAGASDPDPGHTATLLITRLDGSAGGGRAWIEEGLARYSPNGRFDHLQEGQTAEDSFDYEVTDELGAATRGTAKVLVTGVNSPPRLVPAYPVLAFSLLPQAVTPFLLAAATDPDDAGTTLRVHSVDTTGTQGAVFLAGGAVYYLPPSGLALADGEFFTDTFHFTVRDPRGAASLPALATVFVRGDEAAAPAEPEPCPDAGSGGAILIHHLASAEATATHVALPDSAKSSHNFTGPFTVEFWMAMTRPGGWAHEHEALVTKGDSAWRVARGGWTSKLSFDVTGLSPLSLRSSRDVVGGWHHVAAVYDGRYKLLYIDGELDAWAEVTGTPAGNSRPVWLGANSERAGRNFHGAMDEVRIWNHARSAAEIRDHLARTLSGDEPGLLTYYRFDEPTGDLVPNAVSGAVTQPGIAHRQDPDRAPGRFASEIGRSDARVNWEFGTAVLGRHVFYNHSVWDGHDPAASADDDGAIAPDKTALLPGEKAGFAHYTSYRRGLNGVILDVARLRSPALITAADFVFTRGNDSHPDAWSPANPPREVLVRPGAGVCGSDRITLVWDAHDAGTPHAAVAQGWLRVRLLANARTGLLFDDVFHFGNAIGESDDADSITAAQDALRVLNHITTTAAITNPLDFNRDGVVAAQDALIVLNHVWTGFHRPDLRFGAWAAVGVPWTGAAEDALRAEARLLVADALNGAARLTALVPQADGGLRLEYLLPPGRRARLEAAAALGAPWRPVAGPVLDGPADGRGTVRLPAPEAVAQFYRLELLPLERPQ